MAGSGKAYGFHFVMDSHQLDSTARDISDIDLADWTRNSTFTIAVNSVFNFFRANLDNSIDVNAGESVRSNVVSRILSVFSVAFQYEAL